VSPSAFLTPERRIATPKGDVLHAIKASSPGFAGFGEAYFSIVKNGDVKGWKRHLRMTLNLVVPRGTVRFVVHDGEGGPMTQFTLGESAKHGRLTVSPGAWMAFQGRAEPESLLLNIADIEHDPEEAEAAPLDRFAFDWASA
jgi:dTDP-4-dehydrorhamnose 3,5-epimerase